MKRLGIFFVCGVLLFFLNSCAARQKNLFVLLPDPDGKVGQIIVTNQGGSQVVAKPMHATEVKDAKAPPTEPFPMEKSEIDKIFGAALAAQPDPPAHYTLYFRTGSTDLIADSEKLLPEILAMIEARKSTDISVVGHTDRVGTTQQNYRLGLDRAGGVRQILVSKGVDPSIIEVDSHGEDNPLIKTEDEVPEPRNRRVEVTVR